VQDGVGPSREMLTISDGVSSRVRPASAGCRWAPSSVLQCGGFDATLAGGAPGCAEAPRGSVGYGGRELECRPGGRAARACGSDPGAGGEDGWRSAVGRQGLDSGCVGSQEEGGVAPVSWTPECLGRSICTPAGLRVAAGSTPSCVRGGRFFAQAGCAMMGRAEIEGCTGALDTGHAAGEPASTDRRRRGHPLDVVALPVVWPDPDPRRRGTQSCAHSARLLCARRAVAQRDGSGSGQQPGVPPRPAGEPRRRRVPCSLVHPAAWSRIERRRWQALDLGLPINRPPACASSDPPSRSSAWIRGDP